MTGLYPVTVNTETETAHVVRVAGKILGSENVGGNPNLPLMGSEDFSFFLMVSQELAKIGRIAFQTLN